jgi:hypothetical protein
VSGQTLAAALATVVAAACAGVVCERVVRRRGPRPPQLSWAIGFGLFTVAEAALLGGAASGWTGWLYRLYYLSGGILVVPYLAVGELLLVLPGRRAVRLVAATMLFLTFASTAAVLAAGIHPGALRRAGATPPDAAFAGDWPAVFAIALNTAGTAVLLIGSARSALARRDLRPLLVAAGVLLIAAASTLTRFGGSALFAAGQAVGLVAILAGLLLPTRHAARRPRGVSSPTSG